MPDDLVSLHPGVVDEPGGQRLDPGGPGAGSSPGGPIGNGHPIRLRCELELRGRIFGEAGRRFLSDLVRDHVVREDRLAGAELIG